MASAEEQEPVASPAATEQEPEEEEAPAPAPKAAPKPKAKGRAQRAVDATQIVPFVHEALDKMDVVKEEIGDMRKERAKAQAQKKEITKKIKTKQKNQAKKDKVLTKRTTFSLVTELERRCTAEKKKAEKASGSG